jgi:ribosome-binding factor A
MAGDRRVQRVADGIKRVLGELIERKLDDPQKGFITITHVKVSPDLRIATVYYSVLGDERQKLLSKAVLERSKAFLRNELKSFLTMRWLPELRFFYDETQDQAERMGELFRKIGHDSGTGQE